MSVGLLTGLGEGLQQAGGTYGKFKMYDIEQNRREEALQEQRGYTEGRQDTLLKEKREYQDEIREDEQLAALEEARVDAKSRVDVAKAEADIKRHEYMNDVLGTGDDDQLVTRQRIKDGYTGKVYKMSTNGEGGASVTDINKVLKAGKEIFGKNFSLDDWNIGKKPTDGQIKTFNRILEGANMPPMKVQTNPGEDEGWAWFDKEKWSLSEKGKETPVKSQGGGGGLLTDKGKGVAQSRIQPGTGDVSNAERPLTADQEKLLKTLYGKKEMGPDTEQAGTEPQAPSLEPLSKNNISNVQQPQRERYLQPGPLVDTESFKQAGETFKKLLDGFGVPAAETFNKLFITDPARALLELGRMIEESQSGAREKLQR